MIFKKRVSQSQALFIFDGITYEWSGWFGCQLKSVEWFRVPAGTERILRFPYSPLTIHITVFSTYRRGFKYETSWAVSDKGTHADHTARIQELRKALQGMF